jgi:hypothetical protein
MKSLETYVDRQLDLQYIINFYKVCIETYVGCESIDTILSTRHASNLNIFGQYT